MLPFTVDWEIFMLKMTSLKNFVVLNFCNFAQSVIFFLPVDGYNMDECLERF